MVGDSKGTVTRQNRIQGLAPSTCAASSTSSGTAWRPADMRMKLRPRFCQIVAKATAGSAQLGLSRIAGVGLIPSQGRSPTWGFMSVPKITEATATDVATVEEKIVRLS